MLTHRQRLIETLSQGWFGPEELSARLGLPIKEVLDHLTHAQKSVRPPRKFIVQPAACLDCGFVFQDRRRLSPPGRCPRCRSQRIQDPRYRII